MTNPEMALLTRLERAPEPVKLGETRSSWVYSVGDSLFLVGGLIQTAVRVAVLLVVGAEEAPAEGPPTSFAPFVTLRLARRVIAEARRCGGVAAGRWNTETVVDQSVRHGAGPGESGFPLDR